MHIDYEIKGCSHCGNDCVVTLGDKNNIYGLTKMKIDDNGNITADSFLPLAATVCQNCGHVDLIHANAKAIKTTDE